MILKLKYGKINMPFDGVKNLFLVLENTMIQSTYTLLDAHFRWN